MQPVTIKNKHFIDGLWVSQWLLCITLIVAVWAVFSIHYSLSTLLLLMFVGLLLNHKKIDDHKNLQFMMNQSGQMNLIHKDKHAAMQLESYWYLPHWLFLHLSIPKKNNKQLTNGSIYLILWRKQLGEVEFSRLLVGLIQQQDNNNEN